MFKRHNIIQYQRLYSGYWEVLDPILDSTRDCVVFIGRYWTQYYIVLGTVQWVLGGIGLNIRQYQGLCCVYWEVLVFCHYCGSSQEEGCKAVNKYSFLYTPPLFVTNTLITHYKTFFFFNGTYNICFAFLLSLYFQQFARQHKIASDSAICLQAGSYSQ